MRVENPNAVMCGSDELFYEFDLDAEDLVWRALECEHPESALQGMCQDMGDELVADEVYEQCMNVIRAMGGW